MPDTQRMFTEQGSLQMSASPGNASSRAVSPATSAPRSGRATPGSAASPVSPGTPTATTSPGAVMSGFVVHDDWADVQESIYIVLGHGPYQRRVLLCSVLSVIVDTAAGAVGPTNQ
ncbi:hypothetical protein MTO96_042592 [Rhipicephalus appendiculatus]